MRLLFLVLMLLALAPASRAAGPECPALEPALVSLRKVFDEPTLNAGHSLESVRALARDRGATHGAAQTPLGLARSTLGSELRFEIRLVRYDTRPPVFCGAPATVSVTIGFRQSDIVIAREITADPCLYDEVLRHERRHVETDRAVLDEHAPRIERLLREAARRIGVIRTGAEQTIGRRIDMELSAALKEGMSELRADRTRRQQAIDSPEEYARVSNSCDGAVRRIVRPPAGREQPGNERRR